MRPIMQLKHHLCEAQRRLLPKDASFGIARTMAAGLGVAALPGRIWIGPSAFAAGGGKSEDDAEEAADGGTAEEDAVAEVWSIVSY